MKRGAAMDALMMRAMRMTGVAMVVAGVLGFGLVGVRAEGGGGGSVTEGSAKPRAAGEGEAASGEGEGEFESKVPREGEVRVGRVLMGGSATSVCFSSGFLATVERHTRIKVDRRFYDLDLTDARLSDYPFIVMTGDDEFAWSDEQTKAVRDHVKRGGFILASAACSNREWSDSFRKAIAQAFPKQQMRTLPMKHAIFHTLYDIDSIDAKHTTAEAAVYGLFIDDRLVVVFSPLGLNDTSNAGGGCCCCGGNEIRNANLINANVLVYALTH